MKQVSITLMAVGLFVLAGCATPTPEPTATPAPAPSTATPTPEPPTVTVTPVPQTATATPIPPTATPVPPTATATQIPPVGKDITIELPEGDAERGQALAEDEIKGLDGFSLSCSGCHVGARPIGPPFASYDDLPAIGERAALRLAEESYTGAATTPEQYLFESIVAPQDYRVEGSWLFEMDEDYGQRLTRQDVADLIAWMFTLRQ